MTVETALGTAQPAVAQDKPVSHFEFWPSWMFYTPIVVQWIALGLRYGDMSLPTAANPRITAGGLCGESKISILDQVGVGERSRLVPYTSLEVTGTPEQALAQAERQLRAAAIDWPVVAKPDIGCNGTGVRLIEDQAGLARYLREFPGGCRLMLQAFAPEEGEAGIFYVRQPGRAQGRITSITFKHAPYVIGDGRSTLQQLVLADPRAGLVPHLYLPRLAARLADVPAQGERVRLVFVGNHCKGSLFEDATREATPALTEAIERIARAMPEFHFGRFDVRFESLAAFRRGEGFRIIEINGAGSEATHVWDPATTLRAAWRAQFVHYGWAWRIGAANRARGYRPCGLTEMFRLWRRQRQLMASYPMND